MYAEHERELSRLRVPILLFLIRADGVGGANWKGGSGL